MVTTVIIKFGYRSWEKMYLKAFSSCLLCTNTVFSGSPFFNRERGDWFPQSGNFEHDRDGRLTKLLELDA